MVNHKITIFMVIRNASVRQELFSKVVRQASKISKDFYIVNHWSTDDTIQIVESLWNELSLKVRLINEQFEWTMDDMKTNHYRILRDEKNQETEIRNFIFIIDWDEVLDDKLIEEINWLDFQTDVYMINRRTFFINQVIDRNAYLPLLFEVNSSEINTFQKFHKLYKVHSQNIKKLKWIMRHYSWMSMDNVIKKTLDYARWEAQDLFENNPDVSNIRIFLKLIFEWSIYFAYTLFYHFNFLTLEWWFYSLHWYVYKFYKYLFYYELKSKKW